MRVVLLGTGAADGWPNPFCRCDSCVQAAQRGELRAPTSALIDRAVLIDPGPGVPTAAVQHGQSLAAVRHILITHAHADHLAPQNLLYRSWVADTPLDIIGPPDALDVCREWVSPTAAVRFVPVAAGDRITLGDYTVRVLSARHRVFRDGDAVLYDLTGPVDSRLLWATDTGVWPSTWFDAVADAAYDAVFLDETFGERPDLGDDHLGFAGLTTMITFLRDVAAIGPRTDVVAVHLGHHNPPEPALSTVLSRHGARPGRDGEMVRVGAHEGAPPSRTLVSGGVRSGKSRYAQDLLAHHREVTVVATGGVHDDDPDWVARVAEHRRRRPSTWTTVETSDVVAVLEAATVPVLVDCLGTWLTATIDRHGLWDVGSGDERPADDGHAAIDGEIDNLVRACRSSRVPVVMVTNEVGSGVVPPSRAGRMFRDLLGRVNTEVAQACDTVVLMVAGRPLVVR